MLRLPRGRHTLDTPNFKSLEPTGCLDSVFRLLLGLSVSINIWQSLRPCGRQRGGGGSQHWSWRQRPSGQGHSLGRTRRVSDASSGGIVDPLVYSPDCVQGGRPRRVVRGNPFVGRLEHAAAPPVTAGLKDLILTPAHAMREAVRRREVEVRLEAVQRQRVLEVKNGKITRLVSDVTSNAITTDSWNNLDAISDKESWRMFGTTGDAKGQPVQIDHPSYGSPHLRIKKGDGRGGV